MYTCIDLLATHVVGVVRPVILVPTDALVPLPSWSCHLGSLMSMVNRVWLVCGRRRCPSRRVSSSGWLIPSFFWPRNCEATTPQHNLLIKKNVFVKGKNLPYVQCTKAKQLWKTINMFFLYSMAKQSQIMDEFSSSLCKGMSFMLKDLPIPDCPNVPTDCNENLHEERLTKKF